MKTENILITEDIPHVVLKSINHILEQEGGYVNDPFDKGGATNFGISDIRDGNEDGLIDIDLDGIGDVDPKNLTKEQAIAIYYREYWLANSCQHLNRGVALVLFDIAVNQSASWGRKTLQDLVGAKKDGIVGPNTIRLVNAKEPLCIAMQLSHLRTVRYVKKVKESPSQVRFLEGWVNRAYDVLFEASLYV